MKEKASKMWIIGANLLVLLVYTLFIKLGSSGQEAGLSILLGDAMLIAVHVVICIVISIFNNRAQWLLSALAVLLIGFSTCLITVTH